MSAEEASKESHDPSIAANSRDQIGHQPLNIHVTRIPREYPSRIIAPKHRPIRRTASETDCISKKEMIESPYDVLDTGRHVVLLGAGASKAAFPNGDKFSKEIPLMADLIQTLGLGPILAQSGVNFEESVNFEELYSQIASMQRYRNLKENIELRIEEYFSDLQLPDEPTLYDYLLLSLRPGDAVLTFNWDPFLFDAHRRNRHAAPLPEIFFLHGNVRIGRCRKHKKRVQRGGLCPDCSRPVEDMPLLYPTSEKKYSRNPHIQNEWEQAKIFVKEAVTLTIFGYGAPTLDAEAVGLLKTAWMQLSNRMIEHVEIIDIASTKELHERWEQFAPSHHITCRQKFEESWIAKYPRRSREAVWILANDAVSCECFPLKFKNDLTRTQQEISSIAQYERGGPDPWTI